MKKKNKAVAAALEAASEGLKKQLAQAEAAAGGIANRARATEIALMTDFGLPEFLELTGIGAGAYGIYDISEEQVTVSKESTGLAAQQQHELNVAHRRLTLKFPCKPLEFAKWYEATCGTPASAEDGKLRPAPSDFPLADGFLETLKRLGSSSLDDLSNAAPSNAIVSAFPVKTDPIENKNWWGRRLRDPRNSGLLESRVAAGRSGRNNPSYWNAILVALWLIEKKHLAPAKVRTALANHFPDLDASLLG